MKYDTIKLAGLHALGTAFYVVLVALFFFYAPRFLGGPGTKDTVFAPIAMLLLFVFSAAFTGSLVLGRPVLWYLDGKKKEAVMLFASTLGALFIIMLAAFTALVLFRK